MVLVGLGVLKNYLHSNFGLRKYRLNPGALLLGIGVGLFLFEFIFPRNFLEGSPDPLRPELDGGEWVSISREKIAAALIALAQTLHGDFVLHESSLLATAESLSAGECKEFSFLVQHHGQALPVRLRLICADDGAIGCGFFAEPALLAQITGVLYPFAHPAAAQC